MNEEKPKKRLSKKQILIPPIAIGASTMAGLLIMQLIPPPPVLGVCLKAHNVDTFNVHPTVEVVVDGQPKLLPDDIGKDPKEGKECLKVIHTDEIGNNKTITVFDNATGVPTEQLITLGEYNPRYSYYSEQKEFTQISNASAMPPFTDDMVVRYELIPK